jgi:hypothetical protein
VKPYVKPIFEKVELMPSERLSTSGCYKKIYCDLNEDGTINRETEFFYYLH